MKGSNELTAVRDMLGKALEADNLIDALDLLAAELDATFQGDAAALFAAADEPPVIVSHFSSAVSTEFLFDLSTRILNRDQEVTGHDLGGRVASISRGVPCDPEGPCRIEALATYPLQLHGESLGWIAIASPEPLPPEKEEELQEISLFLPLILQTFKRMREVSSRDELTGLFNRRRMEEEIEHVLEKALRKGAHVSLAIADIDNLKKVNDSRGHLAGDRLLKELGKVLTDLAGETDIVGRIGGDEFIVVLPGRNRDEAAAVMEDWLAKLQEHTFDPDALRLSLQISIGVAGFTSGEGGAASTCLARADKALYQAKAKGGNQVVIG